MLIWKLLLHFVKVYAADGGSLLVLGEGPGTFWAFPQGKNNLVAGIDAKELLVIFGLKKSLYSKVLPYGPGLAQHNLLISLAAASKILQLLLGCRCLPTPA